MQVPYLSHRSFLILAVLIDGSEKSYAQVQTETDWDTGSSSLSTICTRLRYEGLINRNHIRHVGRVSEKSISITQAGRQVWIEQVDFYLHFAKRFGSSNSEKSAEHPERDSQNKITPRTPSPDEEKLLLDSATAEFSLFYRALHHLKMPGQELFRANVSDVDFEKGILHLKSKDIVLDETTRPLLMQAAGERTSGPLFLTPGNKRWTEKNPAERSGN